MREAITAIAVLAMLAALVLGVVGLINPKWFGIPSRGKSFGIFFGAAFACLIAVIIAAPPTTGKDSTASSSSRKRVANNAPKTQPRDGPSENVTYRELAPLLVEFFSLTELNQKNWNNANQWKKWVKGTCAVSEVAETGWLSEMSTAAYEVTCELSNDDRAVLFFPKNQSQYVVGLEKGDVIEFKGRLKNIQDWGLWTSGYVKIM